MDLALNNALILENRKVVERSIGISGGKIREVSLHHIKAKKEIDCFGKLLLPGLIDVHVHFREPGFTYKEDWASGSRAALAGGITTVFDMPNTRPQTTTVKALAQKIKLARKKSYCNFGMHFGATAENINEIKKAKGIRSIKIYFGSSTGNMLLNDDKKIAEILKYARKKNIVVCVHAEDDFVILRNSTKGKNLKAKDHDKIRSAEAEAEAIKKLLALQRKTKCRMHFCHLSSERGVKLIANAKKKSRLITAEVSPHHLFLTNKDIKGLGNFGKVNPSIKSEKDRRALWKGIFNGTIDVIATDHAPHTITEKRKHYALAPSGLPGVETMLPLLLDAMHSGKISVNEIQALCCANPAKIFGLKGKGEIKNGVDADLVVVDVMAERKVENKKLFSKCGWSPWNGKRLKGRVEKTILAGKVVFDNGKIIGKGNGKKVFV
jgi:dihydroorotase